ncbi:MAG: hypothetical protein WC450_07240 [Candidatus Omnitrophota bacterium]|jgi:hypothetical protein
MASKEKRYCLRFNKNIFLVEDNGVTVCNCSRPQENTKDNPCAVICVHNITTQALVNQLKKKKGLSDEAIVTSLEPLGYRDWAPNKD